MSYGKNRIRQYNQQQSQFDRNIQKAKSKTRQAQSNYDNYSGPVGMFGMAKFYSQEAKDLQAAKDAEAKRKAEMDKYNKSAEGRGMKLASTIIGPDGLERLSDDRDIQEVLSRKKKIADEGIGLAEREAMRTNMAQQMGQAAQMAGFQMGGSLGGAKGAGIAAQMRSMNQANMMAQAGIERDIFLQNEQVKRSGLESYSSSLGDVKTFDIGQAAKERDIIQSSIMGYEQMDSAERAARIAADAEVKKAKAQCHAKGTKVLMSDETYKNVEDIQVGDEVMYGGKVLGRGEVFAREDMYTLNGEFFSASHLVFNETQGIYMRADESSQCKKVDSKEDFVVYPMITENNCYFTSFMSGDFGMEECFREERKEILDKVGMR